MRRIALAALLANAASAAEPYPPPRFTDPQRRAKLETAFPEIERIFERFQKQCGAPGLVFGVVIDGDLALVKSFGVRDLKSNAPVTPETVFRIASMTKSFTALAVLKLRDAGKLSLDDPVAKWIPEAGRMALPSADSPPLRVRQLLTHGTGLPEDNPWGDQQLGASEDTLTRWLNTGLPFSTPPDTAYEYSNYGFALAGRVVAKASGVPYDEYLEKEILLPLGMKASALDALKVPDNLRATGYRKTGDKYSIEPSLAHGAFGAMGGLHTSARDLARYVAYHLSAWPARDGADPGPVSRGSLREMQSMWRFNDLNAERISVTGYGYGLSVLHNARLGRDVAHGGGLPGFGSYMLWMPERGVGIFAMANVTYAGPGGVVRDAFLELAKTGGLEPRKWQPSPVLLSTRDAIAELWRRWDERRASQIAADNLFRDISAADRKEEIDRLKRQTGECRAGEGFEAENWLRGKFRLDCERGGVEVTFTLAPTMPPKVQHLRFGIVSR